MGNSCDGRTGSFVLDRHSGVCPATHRAGSPTEGPTKTAAPAAGASRSPERASSQEPRRGLASPLQGPAPRPAAPGAPERSGLSEASATTPGAVIAAPATFLQFAGQAARSNSEPNGNLGTPHARAETAGEGFVPADSA